MMCLVYYFFISQHVKGTKVLQTGDCVDIHNLYFITNVMNRSTCVYQQDIFIINEQICNCILSNYHT